MSNAQRVKGFCHVAHVKQERRTRRRREEAFPLTLVEPVFKELFRPRKYRGAKCRMFTRVRAPLRAALGREEEKEENSESKGIIARHLVVAPPPFDFRKSPRAPLCRVAI